ncbi:MAG: peroxide stress protein YaaA, partial [Saprospiraceae bacterium]|nr:peroxide stress protein YaaA [Saprospiraceae bacterium]
YLGLEAETFDAQDFEFADQHLRILSGLYGLLRPLDLMQPYRLEMGTSLKIGRKKNLYQFWGDKITDLINEDLENSQSDFVLNLASKEYFKAVNVKKVNKPIINIHFREFRKGKFTMISFNAKKARGKMAQLIIKDQIQDQEMIKTLEVNGYLYNESMSQENDWFFTID